MRIFYITLVAAGTYSTAVGAVGTGGTGGLHVGSGYGGINGSNGGVATAGSLNIAKITQLF
jgi:hypothetical protein